MYACNGILYNHESERRGETFLTRKVTMAISNIVCKNQTCLYVGNLESLRDWGHAKDYVEGMWKIINYKKPDDFILATGKQYSVKEFVNLTCKELKLPIVWKGKGLKEKGYLKDNGRCIIECDKKYFRPNEVDTLLGDFSKAKRLLKWKPKINLKTLIKEMVNYEIKASK